VVQLDVFERRDLRTDLVKARRKEGVEIGFLDPDAAAPALAAEAVMLKQPLRAPVIHQRIRYADARGDLFWSQHIITFLSIPAPLPRSAVSEAAQNADRWRLIAAESRYVGPLLGR
jgi:hypothetical protein